LLLVGVHTPARAQTFQGSLTGTVTDPSGGVIVGAQVTAVEQATGFSRSGTTGDDGSYSIVLLPPGSYQVTVEKADFDKTAQGPIPLAVNQHQLLNFQMKLGRPTTVLTVEAPAVVVDTQSSSVGTTVGQAEVSETPLNGRQFLELMMFTPGLVPGTPGSKCTTAAGP
jgi:Carboxypeptidase regulatory-like domain